MFELNVTLPFALGSPGENFFENASKTVLQFELLLNIQTSTNEYNDFVLFISLYLMVTRILPQRYNVNLKYIFSQNCCNIENMKMY